MRHIFLVCFLLCSKNLAAQFRIDTTISSKQHSIHISVKDSSLIATIGANMALSTTIDADAVAQMHFPDFDQDGYLDIEYEPFCNYPCPVLYLFDPATHRFIELQDYSTYCYAVPLATDSQYYYSYYRGSCSNMNWTSYLFRLQHFKVVPLARMEGYGCDSPGAINIYKIPQSDNAKEKLQRSLSYHSNIHTVDEKWTFIEQYWNKNHPMFKHVPIASKHPSSSKKK